MKTFKEFLNESTNIAWLGMIWGDSDNWEKFGAFTSDMEDEFEGSQFLKVPLEGSLTGTVYVAGYQGHSTYDIGKPRVFSDKASAIAYAESVYKPGTSEPIALAVKVNKFVPFDTDKNVVTTGRRTRAVR